MIFKLILGVAFSLSVIGTDAMSQDLEEIQVTGHRLTDALSESVYSAYYISRAELDGPVLGLDDALRRVPGFGLFRRQAARALHPTAQGVNLRGLGPNGAGRTLVVLDGIPQNDPFGGWVEWINLAPTMIEQATVVRGGGAGPWGNAALAGIVRLDSRILDEEKFIASVRGGTSESLAGYFLADIDTKIGTFFASANVLDTDGYYLIGRDQRGAADRRAARQSGSVRMGWRSQSHSGLVWSVNAEHAADDFVNGSTVAGANAKTYGLSFSAVQEKPSRGPAWQSTVYARHKDFESVFGAFDQSRISVRPVLDQFHVPATAVGGNLLLRWSENRAWSIDSGIDIRFAEGETNERFRNLGEGFTRERTAGGKQRVAGTFIEGSWAQSDSVLFTAGLRFDRWHQSNGIRQETDLSDGALLVDRAFQNRKGWVANGRLGLKVQLSDEASVTAATYSGFRIPTLNELYRPFRVGNDITEANPELENESMAGAEIVLRWSTEQFTSSAGVFRNDLFDPIINATVTRTPGFNADFGVFIPVGGSLRQRRNVKQVETWGLELDAAIKVSETFKVRASYLFTSPKIQQSEVSPALEGNRLAQVALHQGTISLAYKPMPRLELSLDTLASSRQFEDDQNTRQLGGAVTIDAQVSYAVSAMATAFLAAENLFDAEVEAGQSASGLVTLGAPMFLWVGLRLTY